jgi:hypothetical protein
MYRTVLAFPLLPGKSHADASRIANRFRQQPAEYVQSRNRLGVTMERAYLQHTPMGNLVVAYQESEGDFAAVTKALLDSDLPLDRFFIESLLELHGVDLTQPAGPPPETIGAWTDPAVTTRGRGMAFMAPLLPGRTEAGKAFLDDAYLRDDMTRSRRRLNENLEVVTHISTPQGDLAAIYVEGVDPFDSNARFAASDDPFDVWFRGELATLFPPEIDFGKPVPGVTEIFDSAQVRAQA